MVSLLRTILRARRLRVGRRSLTPGEAVAWALSALAAPIMARVLFAHRAVISRRPAFGKRALSAALDHVGFDTSTGRRLATRAYPDTYKTRQVDEGRRCQEQHLRSNGLGSLRELPGPPQQR
jgi:hypothetical protein